MNSQFQDNLSNLIDVMYILDTNPTVQWLNWKIHEIHEANLTT